MNRFLEILTPDERAALSLRSLYSSAGYSHYKMSKFEEYDLYVRNKDFLVSDNVITFTDTDGRLLALKPDVTLSIIKNSPSENGVMKVYYDENVYRVSRGAGSFREIKQVGLECIGEVGSHEIAEVINLAGKSLDAISPRSVLDLSHLDIVSEVFSCVGISCDREDEAMAALGQKNASRLCEIADSCGVTEEGKALLTTLATLSGSPDKVIPTLRKMNASAGIQAAVDALEEVVSLVSFDRLNIDFSVVGNMRYYNGFAIKGFVDGVPTSVLSGGQYDALMRKMQRTDRAIGFAVYLDEVERLPLCEVKL